MHELLDPDDEPGDDRYSNPAEARKKAMDYLARREYGRVELQRKLRQAGFAADAAESAVATLVDQGLQDDRRFAESLLQSRVNQGKGPVRIRLDLQQRDIDDDTIDECLEEAETDWVAMAQDVRRRKFGPSLPNSFPEKARQMRFLEYRGFESAQIQAALRPGEES